MRQQRRQGSTHESTRARELPFDGQFDFTGSHLQSPSRSPLALRLCCEIARVSFCPESRVWRGAVQFFLSIYSLQLQPASLDRSLTQRLNASKPDWLTPSPLLLFSHCLTFSTPSWAAKCSLFSWTSCTSCPRDIKKR